MGYADKTRVPVSKSRDEIERVLTNYGADKFFFGTSQKGSGIGFEYKGRVIQISVPKPNTCKFSSQASYEREERRMWRVLLIALKAKLELIDANLTTFEDEFLAQTALPNGGTVSSWLQPQILEMIQSGMQPKLLMPGEIEPKGA